MKKMMLFAVTGLVLLSATIYSFTAPKPPVVDNTKIQWYSFEDALAVQKESPKKLFVDVYTDWCKWCQVMDQKTFTDPAVIQYMNENFYAVKFNAEQKNAITYQGKTYEFINGGRRGIHSLAYELLDRQASYPSFVVLGENLERLGIMKGFKPAESFVGDLKKMEVL